MKRIAIVTFCHRGLLVNYGQVFQAFALNRILREKGYNVLTISHKRRHMPDKEAYIREYNNPGLCDMQSKSFAKTTDFVKNNMRCVQTYGEDDICRETHDADILICGSDAIWRTAHYDPAFYLDIKGTEGKLKISYAPSFVNYIDQDRSVYEEMGKEIQKIDYISTRERQGRELLVNICDVRDVKVVLDPTLLWKAEDWKKYMSAPLSKPEGAYIFLYLLKDTNEYDALIKEIQEKYHVERAIAIYTGTELPGRTYVEAGVGPGEWLALLEGAEAVLTNSFHGIAFSLLFHKNFYACKRFCRVVENDFRFQNLFEICDIPDKLLTPADHIGEPMVDNWEHVEEKLEEWRTISMDFLNNALKDAEKKLR